MLACPACYGERDERFHRCPHCDRWWVVLDPEPPPPPPRFTMYHLAPLWEATRMCANGFEKADHILYPCLTTQEEFITMRIAPLTREQRTLVNTCIDALDRMKVFFQSCDVRDLYGGWRDLLPAVCALLGVEAPEMPTGTGRERAVSDVIDIDWEEE